MLRADDLIDFLHQFFPTRARALATLIEKSIPEGNRSEHSTERLLAKFIRMLDLGAADL